MLPNHRDLIEALATGPSVRQLADLWPKQNIQINWQIHRGPMKTFHELLECAMRMRDLDVVFKRNVNFENKM